MTMQSLASPVNLSNMLRLGMKTVSAPIETSSGIDLNLQGEHILVVDDCSPLTPLLAQRLRTQGMRPLVLQMQTNPAPVGISAQASAWAPIIQCNSDDPVAVEQHLARVRAVTGGLSGIIFLNTAIVPFQEQWFAQASQRLKVAIATVRGANLASETPLKFVYFVTAQGGRFGIDAHEVDALASGLEALAHPLRLELPKTSFRTIDLDPSTAPAEQTQQLLQELSQPDQPYRTAYGWQQGNRATLSVTAVDRPGKGTIGLDASSVVVFAGGARGIGAVCAKSLASQVNCHVIFLGRTPLTDEIWELSRLSPAELQQRSEQFIQAFKTANPGCPPRAPRAAWRQKSQALEAISTLQAVQALGAKTDYFALDVRDRSAVNGLFLQLQQRYRKIDVIVHVAGLGGVETDRMLLRKDWSTIDQVIDTKVIGALHLLEAARNTDVQLFLGFGSIASRFGNTGQVDYAAANGLLNGIARAHNATGQSPVARVLSWGAWDGVGMAVSGPTKDMLLAYGLKFISPEEGAACFVQELIPELTPSLPSELYISPAWAALTQLLADQNSQEEVPTHPPSTPKLLGTVLELRPQEFIQAEHLLYPQQICFLDHHRYNGTAWIPAVMGMEVAVEAALLLCPELQPVALRDIQLKKAVRLVRDEPVTLITEASLTNTFGRIAQVQVTLSARFKDRTWVFAELEVLMSSDVDASSARPIQSPQPRGVLVDTADSAFASSTRAQLYPSKWLRWHANGATFQVLDELRQDLKSGYCQGQMTNTVDLSGYETPLTWIDGCFQAYGELFSNQAGVWSGPPLRIGEICWEPELLNTSTAQVEVDLQIGYQTPSQARVFDGQGRCLLRITQMESGGTSLPVQKGDTDDSRRPLLTPYLGQVIAEQSKEKLTSEQMLDAEIEILLKDHKFHLLNAPVVVVPAVYFMEVAVEAAVRLNPDRPPVELQNFQVHRALHFLKEPQCLVTEAEVIAPGKTHVCMFSKRGEKRTLHAEVTVVQGDYTALMPLPFQPLVQSEIQTKSELYPNRFPNGPVFQVINQMILGADHFSQSHLKLNGSPKVGCWLPVTLLDGAFQVDSATRSGFRKHSGLPRSVASVRWIPEVIETDQVQCFSSTGSDATDKPGFLFLMDNQEKTVLLQMAGIRLTPVLPQRGAR